MPPQLGDAQVTACSFLNADYRMKVVKSIKMKPYEVVLLELLSIHIVHRSLWQDALSSYSHQGSRCGVIPSSCANLLNALLSA
jgi:hypothetical protein